MKKTLAFFLTLVVGLAMIGCVGGGQNVSQDVKEIDDLVTTLSDIMVKRESDRLENILAEQLNVAGGQESRQEYIKGFEAADILIKSVQKYDFTERKIAINKDTAIIDVWVTAEIETIVGFISAEGPGMFTAQKFPEGWKITGIDLSNLSL